MKAVLILACAVLILAGFVVLFLMARESRKPPPIIVRYWRDVRVRSSGRLTDEYLKNLID
jgi:hypothetical protein